MRTLKEVLEGLRSPEVQRLPSPPYTGVVGHRKVFMAMEGMRHHVTDEGWQQALGLQEADYILVGHNIANHQGIHTDTETILSWYSPNVLLVQDKREWECKTAGGRVDSAYAFRNVSTLRERTGIFKLTVLKDAHQQIHYHRESAEEMGVHGWVIYYHPDIVEHLAPYVRKEHCIRTYHCVDPARVPKFTRERSGNCLLSGAISDVYPLRMRLRSLILQRKIRSRWHSHPGYGRGHCSTNKYLQLLSGFKVAFCTTSIYGYSVRKIFEAMACGCIVVTDLPKEDVLPHIDRFLVRVSPGNSDQELIDISKGLSESWSAEKQKEAVKLTLGHYNYQAVGHRLTEDIERARQNYRSKS